MNAIGLVAALAAFLGIWFGHVAVRKVEFISPTIWLPTLLFAATGVFLEWLSLTMANLHLSAFLGILGITVLWDALEVPRQQRRVQKGHAPANPRNPRHAALLAAPASRATPLDLLKREPVGRPVGAEEAVRLLDCARGKPDCGNVEARAER
ncbi:MAG: DUF4491 family protein [Chloroflexota bacterium]